MRFLPSAPVLLPVVLSCLGVCIGPTSDAAVPLSQSAQGEARRKHFSIEAGDASVSLVRFVEQSGVQLIYLVDQVRGVKTHAVHGEYDSRDAIERMVAKTALLLLEDRESGALMVQRRDNPQPPDLAKNHDN